MTSSVMAIGRSSLAQLESLQSARGSHDGKPFGLEMIADELARGGIVVDDEHAIGLAATAGSVELLRQAFGAARQARR